MIGSHGFGQGYFGQGPLTLLDIARNIAYGVGVYIPRSIGRAVYQAFRNAVGQG